MKKFIYFIASLINAGIFAIYIALVPNKIVPTHYNYAGIADTYSSKWLLMIMPAILAVFSLFYLMYCLIIKEKKNDKYIFRFMGGFLIAMGALFWVIGIFCLNGVPEIGDSVSALICAVFGVLIIFISNMLPKIKHNSSFGVKTKATLSSETVWRKTHRFSAYIGIIAGLIMIICAIIAFAVKGSGAVMMLIGIGFMIILLVVIPTIYAHTLYKQELKEKNNA
jgi:uncharacterized membrane protein